MQSKIDEKIKKIQMTKATEEMHPAVQLSALDLIQHFMKMMHIPRQLSVERS